MKVYHFSVGFTTTKIRFHGDFMTKFSNVDDILMSGKHALTAKLKTWDKKGEMVNFFEIYRFDDYGDEISIYKWEHSLP